MRDRYERHLKGNGVKSFVGYWTLNVQQRQKHRILHYLRVGEGVQPKRGPRLVAMCRARVAPDPAPVDPEGGIQRCRRCERMLSAMRKANGWD